MNSSPCRSRFCTQAAELEEAAVEGLVREFAASWKSGIEAINQDVLSFFSNFRNGMEILKQVIVNTIERVQFEMPPVSFRGDTTVIQASKPALHAIVWPVPHRLLLVWLIIAGQVWGT